MLGSRAAAKHLQRVMTTDYLQPRLLEWCFFRRQVARRLKGLRRDGRFTRLPYLQRTLPVPEPQRIDQPSE